MWRWLPLAIHLLAGAFAVAAHLSHGIENLWPNWGFPLLMGLACYGAFAGVVRTRLPRAGRWALCAVLLYLGSFFTLVLIERLDSYWHSLYWMDGFLSVVHAPIVNFLNAQM